MTNVKTRGNGGADGACMRTPRSYCSTFLNLSIFFYFPVSFFDDVGAVI